MEPELIENDYELEFDEFHDDDDMYDDEFDEDLDEDEAAEFDFDEGVLEFDEDDDDDAERRGRRRRRRRRGKPKTGSGTGYLQRQLRGYVKRTELRKSLARVGRDIRRNGAAIKINARRISSNRSRLGNVDRLNRKQSKEIAAIRKEMADQRQLSLLMSLLDSGSAQYDVTDVKLDGTGNLQQVSLDRKGDELTALLPLMMGSSGGGTGFDNPLMLMLLLKQ
ncbi:hypothetical protein ILP92_13020 [Maribius pontilimi]|uniref:Uncharacterized protein n=1 Tax=Palleronia pontilimi TaxID=1964209 RepID=A0A934IFY6_9RHOB|nr:hypothetical protein [Palleronia pontilimi]MBJ3763672.1 hypothetical protein [Palleronia pontilimi]